MNRRSRAMPSSVDATFDFEESGLPDACSEEWDSVWNFLQKPRFTRVWVVQESVLFERVVMLCGKLVIPSPVVLLFGIIITQYQPFLKAFGHYHLRHSTRGYKISRFGRRESFVEGTRSVARWTL